MDQSKIKEAKAKWAQSDPDLAKLSPRHTDWGDPVESLYTPADVQEQDYLEQLGFPGEHPFARGVYPSMYLGRPWTVRQYSGYDSPKDTNARFRYLLEQGQTGLSVAFDLPTQIGYDSDHPMSAGEVGKVGVPVDTLEDMEVIFEGLPLDKLSTSMTINAPSAIMLAMYVSIGKKQGLEPKVLRGTLQNDVLKEYTVRGTYIFPPKPSIRLVTDIFEYCSKNVPRFNTINVAGYHMREAGCSAVQEIAFAFSNAIAYIEAGLEAGLDIDKFAPRISWIFNTNNKIFEEVAKYRAARRIWAEMLRDRFGAKDPRSCMLRFHTQTSGASLTAQQPLNNVVRVAYQTLAAVLAGAQSIAACSYDEALSLPTEESVRTSLRTQQILREETGVTDTIDPMGGSYYMEALTNQLYARIKELMAEVEEMGGAVEAIEKGFVQKEIERRAYDIQKQVELGEQVVVGVNKYAIEEDEQEVLVESNPQAEQDQIQRLQALKNRRSQDKVNSALAALKQQAQGDGALMPVIIEAVEAYASLGEICGVLREVFGEYQPVRTI
ncbi:MAG: methylmalonyl-CoA mutase [Proteobacteria bacterium]|nr:methylmalonyl-CoA mutase [Pseudomonadota bacterium]MBU4275626.1 methylmalonyl-CoA mutase [Pseudomonadota bacterium]MBU4382903.1 methylmalonyl-CoA mutase [Pseudomonadota bacterium]MCG2765418.1 methylmalonyl-CoA mutase family protein [Desulfarculaceae bacterium]